MRPRKQDRCDHCEKKAVQQRCAAHAKICTVHADATHGREAEELRAGIEKIIDDEATSELGEQATDVRDALIDLLDRIDARDSLAFCQRAPERELRSARAVLGWKTRKSNEKKRAAEERREAKRAELQRFATRRT